LIGLGAALIAGRFAYADPPARVKAAGDRD
jgi:hypothetical protein